MLMSIAQEPIEAECATYYHRRRLGKWGDIMMDAPWWISLLSKYPPAKPGALIGEPLEAAVGSLTRPQ